MADQPAYLRYLDAAQKIIEQIKMTQSESLLKAAEICADSIAAGPSAFGPTPRSSPPCWR